MDESVRVEKLIPGGQALGTLSNGKKIMFWNALPQEVVSKWHVVKEKNSFVEAIAEEFVVKNQQRIAPQDACYLATSPWQILNYNYELSEKYKILLEIFRQQKVSLDEVNVRPVQTDGQDLYYRNKMEYALYFSHDDMQIYPAFRERGSHRKLPITQSSLEKPEIFTHAQEIIANLNQRHEDARKYQLLLLRCNRAGQVSGGLYENHKPRTRFDNLTDQILDYTYSYSPNGFFQINLPVYEMVLNEIKKHISTDKVLDLYAGVGTIGLSVARDLDLTLVECDKSAYFEMEKNCYGTHARPVLAKSEEALDYIQPDQTVIVDPPRAGCMVSVIERLREVRPPKVIYLSCNPITQLRDITMLNDLYRIDTCIPYNFFPRTPHLENLIVLELRDAA